MNAEPTRVQRIVVLGNGAKVTLGAYVRAWRAVKRMEPNRPLAYSLTGWWPDTAGAVLRQFRDGMHDRINRHVPGFGCGRKWSADWQRATAHAARLVNQPRVRVYRMNLPPWLRARLAHRLSEPEGW